jgi:uncharacterized membrane protein YphA (DoxX/SURF4 family)
MRQRRGTEDRVQKWRTVFERIDRPVTQWMARYGVTLLRVSLGLIFFWFGALKFFPGVSPAEDLAVRTFGVMTLGMIPADVGRIILAAWETAIGLGLISGLFMRFTLLLLFTQMIGALSPIVIYPAEVFEQFPFVPTLEGQYIIKNLVIISGALVIGATVRGGKLTANPAEDCPKLDQSRP